MSVCFPLPKMPCIISVTEVIIMFIITTFLGCLRYWNKDIYSRKIYNPFFFEISNIFLIFTELYHNACLKFKTSHDLTSSKPCNSNLYTLYSLWFLKYRIQQTWCIAVQTPIIPSAKIIYSHLILSQNCAHPCKFLLEYELLKDKKPCSHPANVPIPPMQS